MTICVFASYTLFDSPYKIVILFIGCLAHPYKGSKLQSNKDTV
jgi:hypothetical protein